MLILALQFALMQSVPAPAEQFAFSPMQSVPAPANPVDPFSKEFILVKEGLPSKVVELDEPDRPLSSKAGNPAYLGCNKAVKVYRRLPFNRRGFRSSENHS